jgi:hypothetical protein
MSTRSSVDSMMPHFILCPFDSFTYQESIKQSTYLYIYSKDKMRDTETKKAGYTRRNLRSESNQGHDDDGVERRGVLCVQMCN